MEQLIACALTSKHFRYPAHVLVAPFHVDIHLDIISAVLERSIADYRTDCMSSSIALKATAWKTAAREQLNVVIL